MTAKEIADNMTPGQKRRFVRQFALMCLAFVLLIVLAVGATGFAIWRLIQEVW